MKYKNYHEQKDAENIQRLREVLTTLPSFVSDFFRAKEMSMATTTRISYGYDIRIFFRFLVEKNPLFKNYKTTDFTYEDLDKISTVDIEEYKEYLKFLQYHLPSSTSLHTAIHFLKTATSGLHILPVP